MYISVFSICMHRHTQKYRGYTGFLRYEMLFYIHLLWQNSQSPTLICSMSCEMQTVLIVEAVVMVRAEPHRQVWRGVSFFDHRYGTPKGQAEGPEKPAAWDYYFQPGAAQERQVGKRGVSSSSLSSSASPKHSDSHRHHTHSEASLACFLYSFVPSVCTCGTVTLAAPGTYIPLLEQLALPRPAVTVSPPLDYAPLSQLREGALCCSDSHLEAEIKEERVR